MTPAEMLAQLNREGENAGSDFNDGDLQGWFGWTVDGDVLKVNFEPDDDGVPGPMQSASFRLVAIELPA